MSKSIDFCKQRSLALHFDTDFSNTYEIKPQEVFDRFDELKNSKLECKLYDGSDLLINTSIIHDPDADFGYFTRHTLVHDGTMIFVAEAALECLKRVIGCRTYDSRKEPPKNGASLRYTIGNIVIADEYDEQFAPSDKPWMTMRTTAMLPIKYEVLTEDK